MRRVAQTNGGLAGRIPLIEPVGESVCECPGSPLHRMPLSVFLPTSFFLLGRDPIPAAADVNKKDYLFSYVIAYIHRRAMELAPRWQSAHVEKG
jgi:hypothetical protein